jgi:hypothetical protein
MRASRGLQRESAAYDRRLTASLVPGDQQDDPVTRRNGALQRIIDRRPGAVEVMAMEVERAIRADISRSQALVPRSVEGRRLKRRARRWGCSGGPRWRNPAARRRSWRIYRSRCFDFRSGNRFIDGLSRQRADGRCDLGPKLGLVSG